MQVADPIGQDQLHELVVHLGEVSRGFGQALAQAGADRLRDGPPDRLAPDPGHMIDHVVEHGMGLGAEGRPVLRVQIGDGLWRGTQHRRPG